MPKPDLYPLQFEPILKEKIWGGYKLNSLFNKSSSTNQKLGESWELSGVTDNISVVANGVLQGKYLNELIETYGSNLLGNRVLRQFGNQFPLLFKFIDAADDLSIQLHPDDALAKARHNSFGKTEMWYIMQTEANARLLIGFKDEVDLEVYAKHISENTLLEIMNTETIKKGDAFFIGPGTVHAIGAGTVLAEIQQTSDITYRIYDWDRPGLDGSLRELHTEEAKAAIDFNATNAKLDYTIKVNESSAVCESAYFNTSILKCEGDTTLDYTGLDSFKVYMCVAGSVLISTSNTETKLIKGQTILIPATIHQVHISSENGELLEVYIP